jgi:cardiolipin synthase
LKYYHEVENIKLVYSGNHYFSVLEDLIENAKESIHLQTYIFDVDETGMRIINALKKASQRKVKTYVLIDAYGSSSFTTQLAEDLIQSGIHFRFFSPLFSSEGINPFRRLHHKIIVIDKKEALVGGINIADKYHLTGKETPWLDYAVLIKGDLCEYLYRLCNNIFQKKIFYRLSHQKHLYQKHIQSSLIRFRRNDWFRNKNDIYNSYIEGLRNAKSTVIIIGCYFLPGYTFRKFLARAAKKGVDIRIILAGKTDLPIIRTAENYLYNFYLRNNIKIYEWSDSVMHGKAMIVDNEWTSIGSFNMNYLSRYFSIELNVDIIDSALAKEFTVHVNDIIKLYCSGITNDSPVQKYSYWKQFKMWFAFTLYKLTIDLMMIRKKFKKRR